MSIYKEYFKKMNDEEWEFFSCDVLNHLGYNIVISPSYGADGGKDFIVSNNEGKYIVSCKHYLKSGKHVGVSDEVSILDRIHQHKTNGFIGVYSTGITTSLSERFQSLSDNYFINYYDQIRISSVIPYMETNVLYKYNITPYVMNVSKSDYKILPCRICERDILSDKMIPYAMAGLTYTQEDEKAIFIWGCKPCLLKINMRETVELSQMLHLEQQIYWDSYINELACDGTVFSENFWLEKCLFDMYVRQRMYPQNLGRWVSWM